MPNKARTPAREHKDQKRPADERRSDEDQQRNEDAAHRQQGGWHSDEEMRQEQGREVGMVRDRDYDPDGERPIEQR